MRYTTLLSDFLGEQSRMEELARQAQASASTLVVVAIVVTVVVILVVGVLILWAHHLYVRVAAGTPVSFTLLRIRLQTHFPLLLKIK